MVVICVRSIRVSEQLGRHFSGVIEDLMVKDVWWGVVLLC